MIRLLLAIVFLAIAAFGVLIGVVYPTGAIYGRGHEIERHRVFTAGQGFLPVETRLPLNEDQVLIRVEAATAYPVRADRAVVLTMTASSGGRTEIAQTFTLDGVEPRDGLADHIYDLEGETLYFVADEPYVFIFGPGEAEIPLVYVDLVLIGGTYEIDEVVPPIGWGFMAVGFAGLVLTLRRRRKKPGPPPPRWGRQ